MPPRTLLRILLAITLGFSGLAALSYLCVGLMQPTLADYYAAHADLFPAEAYAALERLFAAPRAFFLATATCYLLEVAGAALMWTLRAAGFHCYTIARLLLLLLPPLFLGREFLSIGDIMFALLYIAVYFYLLRTLGALGPGNPPHTAEPTDAAAPPDPSDQPD